MLLGLGPALRLLSGLRLIRPGAHRRDFARLYRLPDRRLRGLRGLRLYGLLLSRGRRGFLRLNLRRFLRSLGRPGFLFRLGDFRALRVLGEILVKILHLVMLGEVFKHNIELIFRQRGHMLFGFPAIFLKRVDDFLIRNVQILRNFMYPIFNHHRLNPSYFSLTSRGFLLQRGNFLCKTGVVHRNYPGPLSQGHAQLIHAGL